MKVLIAIDDRSSVKETTEFVRQHHWPEDTEFYLLTVIAPVMIDYPLPSYPLFLESVQQESELAASNLLAEATTKIKGIGKFKIHSISAIGTPTQVIIDAAKQREVDLVVVGCHGRHGLDKFFLGSVSQELAAHAPCSVAILRLPPPVEKALDSAPKSAVGIK